MVARKFSTNFEITDVEVAFRELLFTWYSAKLFKYGSSANATTGVRGPFTSALGLLIASQAVLYAEGTEAIYFSEGGSSEMVYILATRHVAFPPNTVPNELYHHMRTSQRRCEVILLGTKAFQTVLKLRSATTFSWWSCATGS